MHDTGRTRNAKISEHEEYTLHEFEEQPETSVRAVSTVANMSQMTVWRMLEAEGLRPYHAQRMHAFNVTNHQPCVFKMIPPTVGCVTKTLPHTSYSLINAVLVGKTFSMFAMYTIGRKRTHTPPVLIHINVVSASIYLSELSRIM